MGYSLHECEAPGHHGDLSCVADDLTGPQSDAVMSSVADRLKVSKSELLDPSTNNAAVRLALAETHVIAETKKFFENVSDSITNRTFVSLAD